MPKTTASVTPQQDVGTILRDAREARDISINSVAVQTNLRAEIIEKLENNDFLSIGAPVFTRGYLHIYARFLGIDSEVVNKGFSATMRSAAKQDEALRLNSANIESQNKPYRRPIHRGWISLILVLLIGGGLIYQLMDEQSWLMQQIRGTFAQQGDKAVTPTEDIVIDEPDEHTGFTVEVADSGMNTATEPFERNPDGSSTEGTSVPELSLSSLESLPTETSSTTVTSDNALTTVEQPDNNTDTTVQDDVTANEKSGITLKTSQENWIEIKGKNGKVLHSKTYKAGDEIVLDGSERPYHLNIGRPAAIELTINGVQKSLTDYRLKGNRRLFEIGADNND